MKRLRSSEDFDSYGKESNSNSNPNPNPNTIRPSVSSHRSFYYKPDNIRKGLLSSPSSASRYDWDRSAEDDREGSRMVRKRSEHDFDGYDRRKGFDRYGGGGGSGSGGDGGGESRGYDRSMMHRSESFSGPRRDFPKGFRSERDRPRREGSVTSWRRIGAGNKEFDKGLRDVRSPTRSGSDQSRVRSPPPRGPRSISKSKSPTWSKDSAASEQSKCAEVRKSEHEVQVESGSSSEMEEGEVEPELKREIQELSDQKTEADNNQKVVDEADSEKEEEEAPVGAQSDADISEIQSERKGKDELLSKEEDEEGVKETDENSACEVKVSDNVVDGSPINAENLPGGDSDAATKTGSPPAMETSTEDGVEGDKDVEKGDAVGEDEGAQVTVEERSEQSVADRMEQNNADLKVKDMDIEDKGPGKEITEENTVSEELVEKELPAESLYLSFKDKGKAVAVTPPTHVEDSVAGNNVNWVEREARDLMSCRGFELFGSSPVKRPEKTAQSGCDDARKEDKLGFEPLDLTLSLPNVLLPIGANAPGSPGRATSVQSMSNNTFRTNSDGFTASVSYSGSQSFYHNPSCSMTTQNSLDNLEQSVKSRPIFQGIDWQALSQNEPKGNKDGPLYQRSLMNGNSSQSQPNMNAQSAQVQHSASSKLSNGVERQLSFHKQLSGGHLRHHDDVKSPSHSVGSHDIGSSHGHDRKRMSREKSSGSLYRSSTSKTEQEQQILTSGTNFVETVIARTVSEPIQSMARKFHEMTGQYLACLKDSVRAILLSPDKRHQITALQKILRDRPDTTAETLKKSHRTQLEILVALKTGVPDYLYQDTAFSSSDLAEIYTDSRCKNPSCRSHIPVDECDCKVCSQKNGFCSTCMCLVCSKFDMASNTCTWVGCDVCLHWCHTYCGLRESYIRNGRSASGPHGSFEMQFHCVACDHPSEMFGFVKEVFTNFAKDWSAETLSNELECVKRIFAASKDSRGRRLHEIAGQMSARLTNKSDLPDVYNYIMAFLNGNIFSIRSRLCFRYSFLNDNNIYYSEYPLSNC